MEEYIKKKDALDVFSKYIFTGYRGNGKSFFSEIVMPACYRAIEELPSADVTEVIRCENCKHSIKKDYDVSASYEYLCILKSTVTHLEEHEANYFCADGDRRDTNE